MNLILFEREEIGRPLPRQDPRARHLLEVLRRRPGDGFDAGQVDGPRGRGTLAAVEAEALKLSFVWGDPPPPLAPIVLIAGLPRPQTARKMLREAAALGIGALHFAAAEKGEPSYARSALWEGEWRRHLLEGAAQAFDTRLPEVTWTRPLPDLLAAASGASARIALDNYESPLPLSAVPLAAPLALAFGPERGWSAREREQLRAAGFALAHLGTRVLRAETAAVAAVAIVKARLGLLI